MGDARCPGGIRQTGRVAGRISLVEMGFCRSGYRAGGNFSGSRHDKLVSSWSAALDFLKGTATISGKKKEVD
jgi:hypothetical protein